MEWVSVNDRLPELDYRPLDGKGLSVPLWVFTRQRNMFKAIYSSAAQGWLDYGDLRPIADVTHWLIVELPRDE